MNSEILLENIQFDDEGWPEFDDESFTVLGEFDDEATEDAEFLPGLGGLLPGLGGLLPGIGGLFGGGRSPAPRRPAVPAPPITIGPGVSTARLTTPGGTASLQLPASVVPRDEFLRVTGELRTAINKNTGHINETKTDVAAARQQATAAATTVTAVRNDLTKYKKDANALRVRDQRAMRAAVAKMREEQRSQAMMSMVMTMMMQNQIQDTIEDHVHPSTVGAATNTGPATDGNDNNMAMMMLPMMMMGGGSGGSNDSMMMMAMVMAMSNRGD